MSLLSTLNKLLSALRIPFILQSLTDLTPSLLLCIIESILQCSLPISPSLRTSNPAAKIQAMKIFLGVLGNDILTMDVGLSNVDPRRLAQGEWDEVVFVGELLCWLGHKMGFLSEPHRLPVNLRAISPSTQYTNLSMHSAGPSSDTSLLSEHSHTPTPRPAPRCIHEVEEPSIVLPTQYHDSSSTDPSRCTLNTSTISDSYCDGRPVPVRHTGWIEEVDIDQEVQSFEASRRQYRSRSSAGLYASNSLFHNRVPLDSAHAIEHASPSQLTLALLNERAKLLAELASLSR